MDRPRDLLLSARGSGIIHPGDARALQLLKQAASLWRDEGRHMNAGYAMSLAIHAAWGNGEAVEGCLQAALEDYRTCVNSLPVDSHEALAALTKLIGELRYFTGEAEVTRFISSLQGELAQRLLDLSRVSPQPVLYLVGGVSVASDLEGPWLPVLGSDSEAPRKAEGGGAGIQVTFGSHVEGASGQLVWIGVPGAFRLLLRLGDYEAANQVVQACPEPFGTVSLCGWPPAIRGFLRLQDPVSAFAEAADLFAADIYPSEEELLRRGGNWSGENIYIWAKYFRALSAIEQAKIDPKRVRELIREASGALEGTESGLVDPQVSRLRVLVRALAGLLGEQPGLSPEDARKELQLQARIFGEQDSDIVGLQLFAAAERAFDELERSPAEALRRGSLTTALAALERLPLLGPDLAKAVAPAVGGQALHSILGPQRTWIHRVLEGIRDEDQLRRVILRLEQSSLPLYAQIRHGPIEFGKDIVVVFESQGRRVLRMYQAKCGDLTKASWRDAQHELEEMFLVPLDSFQAGDPVEAREGILVCNGHPNPYVEPVIAGWIAEQRKVHGWDLRVMHLDDLVRWIVDHRLVNEFRAVTQELGLGNSIAS